METNETPLDPPLITIVDNTCLVCIATITIVDNTCLVCIATITIVDNTCVTVAIRLVQ